MCEDKGIHGLVLVGNENEYAVQTVGEYDAIGADFGDDHPGISAITTHLS